MRLTAFALLLLLPVAAHAALPTPDEVAAHAARTLAAECDDDAPGMAVLVARGDQVLYRGACGKASLELGVDLSPDHVFRIGSVTKQFTAAAVLKLAGEGRLSLDDPLDRFLPGYPGGEAITVRMLLDHTSGVRSYTSMPDVMPDGTIRRDLTTAQLVDVFKDEKPDFAPGQGWRYNNSGYVLAGAVIEAVTGKSWHGYLDEAFFRPLGMASTRYGHPADAVIPGHVNGYTRQGDRWAPALPLSMTQPHAAGALVSTVDDLLRWNRALHGGRVLDDAAYRAMTTPAGKAADGEYGFGIFARTLRGQRYLEHGGGIFGFVSALGYVPGEQVTVAVLRNSDGLAPGRQSPEQLARALAAHAIGRPYPDKTPIEVDAAALEEYAGVYRIDADSTRVMRVSDGHLTSQRTGGRPYRLIPVAKDEFVFPQGHSRVVFERDAEGRVVAMRYFPEDEGEGERVERSDEPPPQGRVETTLPRAALERVAGEYVLDGALLRVFLDGDTPKVQLEGQPALEIFAESGSRFFLKAVDATLRFEPDDAAPRRVVLTQGGRTMVFVRRE